MKAIILALVALALTGCASTDYKAYADAQIAVASARAEADKAKYAALAQIAQTGSDAARVAAVMSLQMGGQPTQPQSLMAPRSTGDALLQWASVLVPAATQAYAIGKNAAVQIESSRNAAAVAKSTNEAFVGIASQIQAPGAVTTTTTTTTTNTDSTHAPTVVTAPDPVIVTQPAPVIVQQPDPIIVQPAEPIVVTTPPPLVVTQPEPIIVQPVVP